MALAKAVYVATRTFPVEERYCLTSQLRRAAVSVASNIAEGRGRTGSREFMHFLGTARGSAYEIETQAELAIEFGFGNPHELRAIQEQAAEVVTILNASISTLHENTSVSTRNRPRTY